MQIPRVDSSSDTLGLTVLDEPCAKQSDPHVLDLTLRSLTKQTNITKQLVSNSVLRVGFTFVNLNANW